jgi:hypothetical protein
MAILYTIYMLRPRTPFSKLFINIQNNRWQHVHTCTLLSAHLPHLSSPHDLNTATHIHVSTYRSHFTPLSIIYKTCTLKKIIIPDSPLRPTSISTLSSLSYPLNLYDSMAFITSKELKKKNSPTLLM